MLGKLNKFRCADVLVGGGGEQNYFFVFAGKAQDFCRKVGGVQIETTVGNGANERTIWWCRGL